ncbi:hypothetical protein ACWDBT_14290 [Streptomyces ardesiacus]
MLTKGAERGNLEDLATGDGLGRADVLLLFGTSLVAVGLIGGSLRALARVLTLASRGQPHTVYLDTLPHRLLNEWLTGHLIWRVR